MAALKHKCGIGHGELDPVASGQGSGVALRRGSRSASHRGPFDTVDQIAVKSRRAASGSHGRQGATEHLAFDMVDKRATCLSADLDMSAGVDTVRVQRSVLTDSSWPGCSCLACVASRISGLAPHAACTNAHPQSPGSGRSSVELDSQSVSPTVSQPWEAALAALRELFFHRLRVLEEKLEDRFAKLEQSMSVDETITISPGQQSADDASSNSSEAPPVFFEAGSSSIIRQASPGLCGSILDRKCFVPNPYGRSPAFYVPSRNNSRVIVEVLECRGWHRLPQVPESEASPNFDLKWLFIQGKIDYDRLIDGQLVNRVANHFVITSKKQFLDTIRAHEKATGERFTYHPRSFCSARPDEMHKVLSEVDTSPEAVWILKPSRGKGGAGILISKGKNVRGALHGAHSSQSRAAAFGAEGWVVQKYVERPLLLQGRKFDVRVYCLLSCTAPHIWFFHPGYCRVALGHYDLDSLSDRFAHLTNASVQKAHPDYRDAPRRGRHIWSEAEAAAELTAAGYGIRDQTCLSGLPLWSRIQHEMKLALVGVYRASHGVLDRRRGCFHLLGVDFMLDEDLQLHLLEINNSPAWCFESSPTLKRLIPLLIGGTIDTVLEVQRSCAEALPCQHGSFELIVHEGRGYFYGGEAPKRTAAAGSSKTAEAAEVAQAGARN